MGNFIGFPENFNTPRPTKQAWTDEQMKKGSPSGDPFSYCLI